ncbi:MAG: class I SAM-dependent methyltransferase [Prevotellaceae bacterium]|nr:class I SAM-dependent methyltransferase [Prevotella sp.]MDD7256759.1 class I SAM-dependent methyltransferase [Prevotellaceae bacterium]MDY6130796.1 class I SAM-dependent methyltransferase [Prevotella sp.]
MNDKLENYLLGHIDAEGDYLYRLYRATNVRLLRGRMASGHLQGRLLKMLVRMIRPKNILEVGTFSGYSAICLAEGLEEGGKVYTFEINDEMEDFTRPWIEGSAVADKINFMIGDAITEAPKLDIVFDMAFIDGDKRTYLDTYEMVLKVVRKGGFILADNTLWDGHVLEQPKASDGQTRGIEDFNDFVAKDDRVEKVILPLRDGLTLIRIV